MNDTANNQRNHGDIAKTFNRNRFMADCTASLLLTMAENHIAIDDKTMFSSSTVIKAAVRDMEQSFDELLTLYIKALEAAHYTGDYS